MMRRLWLAATACLMLAPSCVKAETPGHRVAAPPTRPWPQNKGKGDAFDAKGVEAAQPQQDKPRQGWNGFYGGLNGGGASGHP